MKYIRQFGIILLITFIGEIMHELIPIPGTRGYIRYRSAFHRAENRNSPAVRGQGRFQVPDTDNAADVHSGRGGTY